jgi:hypothetical protein
MHDKSCKFGGALRDLHNIAESAKNDRRKGLGPEFAGFEIEDLNAKQFVHKHVFGDLNADQGPSSSPPARLRRTARPSRRASARARPNAT